MSEDKLPVYATLLWSSSEEETTLLGVALDMDVAHKRLTNYLAMRFQAVYYSGLSQEDLREWARATLLDEDSWYVSDDNRLWLANFSSIEIQERDAAAPLEGKLV